MLAAQTRLRVLGTVRAEQDGDARPLHGTQPQLVLVATALRSEHLIPRDELAELLWPAGRGRHWEGALRGVVSKIRTFLDPFGRGGPVLESTGRGYRLRLSPAVTLDVEEAAQEARRAEDLHRAGDVAGAAEAAAGAIELLSDPLLPGVDAPWLEPRREELLRLRLGALRTAAALESTRDHHDRAIAMATAAVTADRWDEASHRALMAAHLAAQDRSGALRAYGRCRRILTEELGVPPSTETEALHLEIIGALASGPLSVGDRRRPPSEAPFVGREAELGVLEARWAAATRGRRQVVVIRGESGAGKTRLAVEGARSLEPAFLLYGRSGPERATPFEPFVEALGRQFAQLDDDQLARTVGTTGSELARYLPELTERLGVEPPGAPAANRAAALAAVRSVLQRIASEPTIVILDDVHWADADTLAVLRHLVVALEGSRLLWVVNQRADVDPTTDLSATLLRIHELPGVTTVPLGGLDVAAVAELLAADGVRDASDVAEVLVARTGGNPFYLHQVLSVAWEDPDGLDPHRVPDTVSELVRHRVALLSPGARDLLSLASVIGTVVDDDVLAAAAEVSGIDLGCIDELIERHLMVEIAEGGFGFAHGIVREAVEGNLARSRRRRHHRAVARAVDDLGRDDPRWAATLAHHLVAAEDPATAPAAVAAAIRAGDHAMDRFAYDQAVERFETARRTFHRFELSEPGAAALDLRLGAARRRAGDFAGARRALESSLATAGDDSATFARAALELVAHGGRGVAVDWPDERRAALLQEAADRLGPDGDDVLVVAVHAEAALALLLTDQYDRLRSAARLAEDRALASGRSDLRVQAMVASRLRRPRPDQAAERLALTDDLVGEATAAVTPEQAVRLHMWRLTDCTILGDRDGFDTELAALRDGAEELGQPYWRWLARSWEALAVFLDGDVDGADEIARRALDAVEGIDHPEPLEAYGIQLVGFRLQQGRGAEVVALLAHVAAGRPTVPAMRCGLTFALAQGGDRDAANHQLGELAADDFAVLPDNAERAPSLAALAEAACLLGRVDLAERLIPLLEPFRHQFVVVTGFGGGGACWGPYAGVLGSLRTCVGDVDGAAAEFDVALAAVDRFGAPILRERITATPLPAFDRGPEQGPWDRAPGRADSEVVDLRDQDRPDDRRRR